MHRMRIVTSLMILGLALLLPAAAAGAVQTPFGHPCTTQADGVRFCPTTDAGAGRTVDGVPSFDGVPLDVDVTLPSAQHAGSLSDDRDAARLRRRKDRLRVERPRRRRLDHLPLQQRLLRPARLRGRQLHRSRLRPLLRRRSDRRTTPAPAARATSGSPTPATRRATPSTCSACSSTRRSPSPAPSASTGISYGGGQSHRARLPAQPHPPARRDLRAVDEPEREVALDRRRLAALALVGPGRFAAAQRALPRHQVAPAGPEPRTGRDRDRRATSSGLYALGKRQRLLLRRRARRASPAPTPTPTSTADFALVNAGEPPSTLAEGAAGRDLRPSPGLRPAGHTGAPADRERLDRRPLPARAGDPHLQPGRRQSPVSLQLGDLGHSRGSNKPTVNRRLQ